MSDSAADSVELRQMVADDAEVFASWARDPDFCRQAGWTVGLPREECARFWRGLIEDGPSDLLRLAVVCEGEVVGYVDLHGSEPKRRELGFVIGGRERWASGLGRSAAGVALAHGFDTMRLDEIWAEALDANQRSVRLLQRLGMTETGRGDDETFLGQPTHYRQFAIAAHEWGA